MSLRLLNIIENLKEEFVHICGIILQYETSNISEILRSVQLNVDETSIFI